MESVSFLQDLAVVLGVSGLVTLLFHKANQPRVVGYILAGLLIGPHTPPFSLVDDESTIVALAELGVVFLMFSMGLEFNLRRLRRVGLTAMVTAILDVCVMVWLGFQLGQALGWSTTESLFLGGILCDSSTTILMKILNELKRSNDKAASLTLGISVVEDVLAVAMMALLTGVGLSGEVHPGLVVERLWTLGIFLVVVITVGLLLIPRVLNYLGRFENDELLVVGGVGMCFAVALVAVKLELSLALGAVLVGMLASEARVRQRLQVMVAPLRSIFSAVFFVSLGLMFNPAGLGEQWVAVLLATACIVGGKFVLNTTGALLTGQDTATSFRVGAGMAQVGEFGFIIAALGVSLHATGPHVYQVGVAATVFSIILSPYLIRGMHARADGLADHRLVRRWIGIFQLYSDWSARIRHNRPPSAVRQIIRRSILMMLINVMLIAGILGVAALAAKQGVDWLPESVRDPVLYRTVLWLAAILTAMPLYLVTLRKFNALGMVLAEVGLPMTITGAWARHMRTFIAHVVTLAGGGALVLLTFILSASMWPTAETLLLLVALIAIVSLWGRRRLLRVYQRAQMALGTVLEEGAGDDGDEVTLDQLRLANISIRAGTAAVGQTLRQLELRSHTGVSVVGVERGGTQMVNPDPSMPLQPGDRLVMLGSEEQAEAATAYLATPARGG